jgi:hypothetical protein
LKFKLNLSTNPRLFLRCFTASYQPWRVIIHSFKLLESESWRQRRRYPGNVPSDSDFDTWWDLRWHLPAFVCLSVSVSFSPKSQCDKIHMLHKQNAWAYWCSLANTGGQTSCIRPADYCRLIVFKNTFPG